MNVVIRPARPEDAAFLAHVMLLAGRSHLDRGFWDISLNRPEPECLAYLQRLALTGRRSITHQSHFIVAEVDGQGAAALCGYDPGEAGKSFVTEAMNQVSRTIGWREAENLATRATWATIRTCLFSEAPGEWIIENVATLPAFRRRGLGNALLAEILAKGRRKGCRRAQISVLIGNTPAQQAYEKVGFQVVDEKRHPDFEALVGARGIRRLAARIDYEQGEHPCSRSATIIPLAKLFR